MRNRRSFILLIALLCAVITMLPLTPATGQEQKQEPEQARVKFRLAPTEGRNVKADVWQVSFDRKLSEEDFEAALARVLREYGAQSADVYRAG